MDGSRTVMIVEDHPLWREALASLLGWMFPLARVVQATTAGEARTMWKEYKPQAVLMDINLPDGSGLELTGELKQELPTTKVVICTGHDCDHYRAHATTQRADHYVTKEQVDVASLGELLQEILGPPAVLDQK